MHPSVVTYATALYNSALEPCRIGGSMGTKKSSPVARKKPGRPKVKPAAPGQFLGQERWIYISLLALIAAVGVCYANSLANGFVFDDNMLVMWRKWPQTLGEAIRSFRYVYRPLRDLSYSIDMAAWGKNPFGFHLTNVLIHAVNTTLVFFLMRGLTSSLRAGFVSALIFAVHPLQIDSVTYISGRRDVLFALFYISALLFYGFYRRRGSRWILLPFWGCWGLSLLSKEMAASLPLVVFTWNFCDLWREQPGGWAKKTALAVWRALGRDKYLYALLGAAIVAVTYYYVFVAQASGRVSRQGVLFWGGSYYTNLLMAVRAQAWYLKQLVFPTPIAQYLGAFGPSSSLLEWRVLVSLAVTGGVIFSGFALLKRNKLAAFAILGYFVMLLPVSQIIPHHEFVADHYLYLPIMMFGLLVGLAIDQVALRRPAALKPAYAALGVAVAALGFLTIVHNRDWKDEFSLWEANYRAVPNSPRAAVNLANEYIDARGDLQKAEYYFKQALVVDPNYESTYTALARLYLAQGRLDSAEEIIAQGLAVCDAGGRSFMSIRKPHLFRSNLLAVQGSLRKVQGDNNEAERLLNEAIKLQPGNLVPYSVLANLYHETDPPKEIEILRSVLAVRPTYYEIRVRLASLLLENQRFDEALNQINRALTLSPDLNDCDKASSYIDSARRAIGALPKDEPVAVAFGRLELQCGNRTPARPLNRFATRTSD
jgi:tetratricopeptide (TPR) repeat protein